MSKRDWIEVTASVIGGAGLGAALMYMLDPESGEKRRQAVRDAAADAAESAGEHLGSAWDTVSSGARSLGGQVADHAGDAAGGARDAASRLGSRISSGVSSGMSAIRSGYRSLTGHAADARDSASDFISDSADSARAYGKRVSKGASNYGRNASKGLRLLTGREEESSGWGTAAGVTAATIGALALGAGVMFFLDPSQGRRRRAMAVDKASSAARQTGRQISRTSRHVGNMAQGVVAQTKSAVGNMMHKGEQAAENATSSGTGGSSGSSSMSTGL